MPNVQTFIGDVFQLNVLGKPIVVINSEKAAVELMEKRSANYSDRAPMPLLERSATISQPLTNRPR